jgi:hypothetical protein
MQTISFSLLEQHQKPKRCSTFFSTLVSTPLPPGAAQPLIHLSLAPHKKPTRNKQDLFVPGLEPGTFCPSPGLHVQ